MKTKGLTFIELLAVIASIVLLVGVLVPALRGSRQTAVRLICQTNLTGIGRAMAAFAEDHDGGFPRAGTPRCMWSEWGHIGPSWYHPDRTYAFRYLRATITSSFYLLIKYYKVTPKQFICKGDAGDQEFTLNKAGPVPPFIEWGGQLVPTTMLSVWDFGGHKVVSGHEWPWPGEFCSYAYHMPYKSPSAWTSLAISYQSSPATPVCADRNPFLDKNALDPNVGDNSAAHQGKGQNVLYINGSVKFEKTVTVGLDGDNIYTYGGGPIGTPPTGNGDGFPADYSDAYLVGEKNY